MYRELIFMLLGLLAHRELFGRRIFAGGARGLHSGGAVFHILIILLQHLFLGASVVYIGWAHEHH